jgi:hypothetical protein
MSKEAFAFRSVIATLRARSRAFEKPPAVERGVLRTPNDKVALSLEDLRVELSTALGINTHIEVD